VRAKGGAKTTEIAYRQHLTRFRDWLARRGVVLVKDITDTLILEHWAFMRRSGYSDSTLRASASVIRRLLRLADQSDAVPGAARVWGKVAESMPRVRAEVEPDFPVDELRRLLAEAEKGRYALRNVALLLFMVDSGLRISELLALRVGDVDLATGRVLVASGKGAKTRTVGIGQTTRAAVDAYLEDRVYRPPDSPLWRSQGLDPLSAAMVRKALHEWADAAGVKNAHPHRFRKTFCTAFLRDGGGLLEASRLLGHSSTAMTQRVYAALVSDDLLRAHEKHGPADRLGLGRTDE
jgi:site-specific recombinase XerD